MAYQRFRALHLEAPTPARITRLIRSARHTFEQRLYETTLARLPKETQTALDALLEAEEHDEGEHDEGVQVVTLQELRMDPGRVGLATVLQEMAKLRRIRELHLPADLFAGIAHKVLAVYRNRASVEEPSRLRAHDTAKRLTYLSALCVLRSQEITDGLVDLLIQIVRKIQVRAEDRVEQEYVKELKRIAGKDTILYHIAEAAVEHPDGLVREVVFPVARMSWGIFASSCINSSVEFFNRLSCLYLPDLRNKPHSSSKRKSMMGSTLTRIVCSSGRDRDLRLGGTETRKRSRAIPG
jgi:hypothetical protein